MGIHCSRCGVTLDGAAYWAAVYDVNVHGDEWRTKCNDRIIGIFYCKKCLTVANTGSEVD